MNTSSLKSRLATLALLLGAGSVLAPAASAYTVYALEKNYYAIVCQDGQIFSYGGGPDGIGTVGPALCEGHGGIAGPGGGVTIERAPQDLVRTVGRCGKGAGQKVSAQATRCPAKFRGKATRSSAKPQRQQAPAKDYNSSRSNKPRS